MSLAGPTGRAWAALDGAVGRRVSGGRLGERLGRLGLRPGQDRSPATGSGWNATSARGT